MDVILNIGLHSDKLGKIAPVTALSAVRLAWLQIKSSTVVQSDTEPTLVLVVKAPHINLHGIVRGLAKTLGQDCIAIYDPCYCMGNLLGPKAAEWGPFNPEFFILPDGTRLAEPAAKAA
jgi:hypothetical protein